jgi:hypothetical protein
VVLGRNFIMLNGKEAASMLGKASTNCFALFLLGRIPVPEPIPPICPLILTEIKRKI